MLNGFRQRQSIGEMELARLPVMRSIFIKPLTVFDIVRNFLWAAMIGWMAFMSFLLLHDALKAPATVDACSGPGPDMICQSGAELAGTIATQMAQDAITIGQLVIQALQNIVSDWSKWSCSWSWTWRPSPLPHTVHWTCTKN